MKIGTIGTGEIVEKFLGAVEINQGAKCVAVYSRKAEKAEKLGEKFHIDKYYTHIQQMWEDEEINFIYIGSPNSLHYEYAKEAMEHGKNVICEKPFTSNAEELKKLAALAKEKNLFLFEAITTIHLPNVKYIKENLSQIGEIKIIRCNFSQFSSRYVQLMDGQMTNVFDLNFSGGALVDLNIYNIHFVMNLFGTPKKVMYLANHYKTGIDTSGIAILEYDGFLAECCGSKDSECENSCEIQGSKGFIRVNSQCSYSNSITLQKKGCEAEEYNIQEIDNALYYELREFIKIYREKNLTLCYELLEYSVEVMSVLDKARESAAIEFPSDKLKSMR